MPALRAARPDYALRAARLDYALRAAFLEARSAGCRVPRRAPEPGKTHPARLMPVKVIYLQEDRSDGFDPEKLYKKHWLIPAIR